MVENVNMAGLVLNSMNNCLRDILSAVVNAIQVLTAGFVICIIGLKRVEEVFFRLLDVKNRHCSLANRIMFFAWKNNTLPCSLTGTNL